MKTLMSRYIVSVSRTQEATFSVWAKSAEDALAAFNSPDAVRDVASALDDDSSGYDLSVSSTAHQPTDGVVHTLDGTPKWVNEDDFVDENWDKIEVTDNAMEADDATDADIRTYLERRGQMRIPGA